MNFADEPGWNIVIGRCHCPNLHPKTHKCLRIENEGKECTRSICKLALKKEGKK